MSRTPPFRSRPQLHLAFTNLNGSPRHPSQDTPASSALSTPSATRFAAPLATPLATTAYSPFRSAGLKPPAPYGGPMHFTPRRGDRPSHFDNYTFYRIRRSLSSKPLLFLLVLAALTFWWSHGGSNELDYVKLSASGFGRELLQDARTQDLQFFPATNPKIHYIGRWTSTPNRLRKDGAFPGVYFDVTIKDTTTLLLSLHNAAEQKTESPVRSSTEASMAVPSPTPGRISFRPPPNEKPSPPISLLARVDQEEYILLPNASALVSVCSDRLSEDKEHHIRIVAPMTDDQGRGIVELEGIWLSKGGKLVRVDGSLLSEEYADEDLFHAENDQIGERHRTGLNDLQRDNSQGSTAQAATSGEDEEIPIEIQERKKILEVITDSPGSLSGKQRGRRTGGADGLLAGVMGWEYLLGEMFAADHVGIGVDGMCLTQNCIGGTGQPAGIGDVFFRRSDSTQNIPRYEIFYELYGSSISSGPYGSAYFEYPWMFDAYVPDVIVLNLGGSDEMSFGSNASDYALSRWELSELFENTYVSLIRAIRALAYPKHPSIVHSERLGSSSFPITAPASIPIFVLRPLRGEVEHETQNVVSRLRADGDKAIFWLDTSGWLDLGIESTEVGDFFLDEAVTPSKWRLTEQGNQRVAIFLHMHVCRYLAGAEERCAFLPHEVYQGKVFDPEEANFDRYVENEKERKLKKLFWEDRIDEVGL